MIEFERGPIARPPRPHATPSKLHGERKMSVTRYTRRSAMHSDGSEKIQRRIINETKQLNIFTPKPVNKQACARCAFAFLGRTQCLFCCGGCLPVVSVGCVGWFAVIVSVVATLGRASHITHIIIALKITHKWRINDNNFISAGAAADRQGKVERFYCRT